MTLHERRLCIHFSYCYLHLQQKINQEQEKKLTKKIQAEQEQERKNFASQQKKEYKLNKEQIKKVGHSLRVW